MTAFLIILLWLRPSFGLLKDEIWTMFTKRFGSVAWIFFFSDKEFKDWFFKVKGIKMTFSLKKILKTLIES